MATSTGTTAPARGAGSNVAGQVVLVIGAGIATWLAAPLVGYPQLAWPALIGGVVVGVIVGLSGARSALRRQLAAQIELAIASVLGPRVPWKIRGWARGWPGVPKKVLVHRVLADPQDPGKPLAAAKAVSAVIGRTYTVAQYRPERGRLVLIPAVDHGGAKDEPHVARAKELVTELLGHTAQVHNYDLAEDGELSAMDIKHSVSAKLVPSGYRLRIERAISATLPGEWRAQWNLERDTARFELRPQLPTSIWLPPVDLKASSEELMADWEKFVVRIGVTEDKEEILWQPAVVPHMLVAGPTGGGKTSTIHGILAYFSHTGFPLWVADGKGVEFLGFQDWPNVQIVASIIEEQVAVIHQAWELMMRRYNLVRRGQARVEDFEPLFLLVDEYSELKANLMAWYGRIKVKGDPRLPDTITEYASLLRLGRTSRVHLLTSLQRADADIVGGEARSNIGFRASVGRLDPDGAAMIWGHPGIGSSTPRGRRGRGVGVNSNDEPAEAQFYRTPNPYTASSKEELEILEALRPAESRQERLVIVPPEPMEESDWDEPIFSQYLNAEWARAVDRPDLDPLAIAAASGTANGREMSSVMAVLGLTGTSSRSSQRDRVVVTSTQEPEPVEAADVVDDYYAEPATERADAIAVGDLVDIDGRWVVVDEEVEVEDGLATLMWRDDNDGDPGMTEFPADDYLTVRPAKRAGAMA